MLIHICLVMKISFYLPVKTIQQILLFLFWLLDTHFSLWYWSISKAYFVGNMLQSSIITFLTSSSTHPLLLIVYSVLSTQVNDSFIFSSFGWGWELSGPHLKLLRDYFWNHSVITHSGTQKTRWVPGIKPESLPASSVSYPLFPPPLKNVLLWCTYYSSSMIFHLIL